MKAILMLEDGRAFFGKAQGAEGDSVGELILNTAVVGYQEMMTDPANSGKILVLTYPLLGNYGIAPQFNESNNVWLAGLAMKKLSSISSNWQARGSLSVFIKEHNLPAISEVDTRTLSVHLRQKGQMLGVISTSTFDAKWLLSKIDAFRKKIPSSALPRISVARPKHINKKNTRHKKIVVLDLGITRSIIRQLQTLGLYIIIAPYNTPAKEILNLKPRGVIISNGPEEDDCLKGVIVTTKALIGRLPILGISTGHQVLGGALGAKITKMKLGHHGINYPVHNPASYKGSITVQNHSYVVDIDTLNQIKGIKITGYNLNDRSVEEIESKKLKIIGIQYYPASPGFHEVNDVFKRFMRWL